jgi:hypothetical protein
VWLAFVLMPTIFIVLRQNLLFASFLARKKFLQDGKYLFFGKKARHTKSFDLG